jgi:hypothetical protein
VRHRIFADLSDDAAPPMKGQGKWRAFRDKAELKKVAAEGAANTQAFVWRAADRIIYVELFSTSDSGDWAQYSDHCFRADGSLARLTDTLNTFNAVSENESEDDNGVSRIRIRYFAPNSRQLAKKSRLLGLTTKRPIKSQYGDQPDVIFQHLADLPFAGLLDRDETRAPAVPKP